MSADRRVAAGAKAADERPLGLQRALGGAVTQRRERRRDAGVAHARLDRERPLAGGRHELRGRAPAVAAEPPQAGNGEQDRVEVPGGQAGQPRVEVAVQLEHGEIVARLLHEPTIRLKSLDPERVHGSVELLRDLFALHGDADAGAGEPEQAAPDNVRELRSGTP